MAAALSKSMYCSGLQCPKMLWLKKHRPEQFDETVMNQAVLETGNEVGDLAMVKSRVRLGEAGGGLRPVAGVPLKQKIQI